MLKVIIIISLNQGLDLLLALTYSQRRSSPGDLISSLDLRGFFSSSVHVYTNPQVPRILGQFKGLTNLSLNYSYLTDKLLTALQYRPQGQGRHPRRDGNPLQRLSLQCSSNEYHQQVSQKNTDYWQSWLPQHEIFTSITNTTQLPFSSAHISTLKMLLWCQTVPLQIFILCRKPDR